MPWIPISANHSIERALISIRFATSLSQKSVSSLGKALESRQPELDIGPKADLNVEEMTVATAGPEPIVRSKRVAGWRFQRLSAQEKAVESLALVPDSFTYEISEYSRWELFLNRYLEIAAETLRELFSYSDIQSVDLDYFDRFVFEGDPHQASPECLLASPFFNILADSARLGRDAWHLHRGWFECREQARFLVNQNLDVQHGKNQNGKVVSSLAIMTRVEYRNIDGDIDTEALSRHLGEMHRVSIEVFRMVLHDDMKTKIGLN